MMTTQDFSDFLFKTAAAVASAEKSDLCVRHKDSFFQQMIQQQLS
jgi:hypothetical protein